MNEAENNPGRARVLEGTSPSLRKHKGVSYSRQSWVPAYTVTAIWHARRGQSTSSPELRPETELGCRPHCPITGRPTPPRPHVQRPPRTAPPNTFFGFLDGQVTLSLLPPLTAINRNPGVSAFFFLGRSSPSCNQETHFSLGRRETGFTLVPPISEGWFPIGEAEWLRGPACIHFPSGVVFIPWG